MKNVLVVDDQPHTRSFVRAVLERNDWTVLEAADESSAWDVVQQTLTRIDLAIIDVDLPGVGGQEVARWLQALHSFPVLFMSGYSHEHLVARAMLSADAPLLAKPFTVAGLLAAIRQRLADAVRQSLRAAGPS